MLSINRVRYFSSAKYSSHFSFLVRSILHFICGFVLVLIFEQVVLAGSIELKPLPFPPPTQIASDFKDEFMEIADIAFKNAIPALSISLIIRKLTS
jgi:hypothetical protein